MIFDFRDAEGNRVCMPCTPGGKNASKVIEGDEKAMVKELFVHTPERALCILTGLYVAGYRKDDLIVGTIVGSIVLEAFVLGYSGIRHARG